MLLTSVSTIWLRQELVTLLCSTTGVQGNFWGFHSDKHHQMQLKVAHTTHTAHVTHAHAQVSGHPRFHSTNKVERFKSMQGGLGAIVALLIPSKPLCSSQPLTFSWIFSKLEELLFNFGLRSAHYIHLWLDGAWHYSSPPWQAVV